MGRSVLAHCAGAYPGFTRGLPGAYPGSAKMTLFTVFKHKTYSRVIIKPKYDVKPIFSHFGAIWWHEMPKKLPKIAKISKNPEKCKKTVITLYFSLFIKIKSFTKFRKFNGHNIILNGNIWLEIWVYEPNLIVFIQKFEFLAISGHFSPSGVKFWIPFSTWNLDIFGHQKSKKSKILKFKVK